MTHESISVERTVNALAETVFGIIADPTTHAAIDGTGWVRESLDGEHLTRKGQVFRMAMYHDNHPNHDYQMANRVRDFEPPTTISWDPGQDVEGKDDIEFGGWFWRYDLTPVGDGETRVKLSYDWSEVPQDLREHIGFPPFDKSHLENSLEHLADLAADA